MACGVIADLKALVVGFLIVLLYFYRVVAVSSSTVDIRCPQAGQISTYKALRYVSASIDARLSDCDYLNDVGVSKIAGERRL